MTVRHIEFLEALGVVSNHVVWTVGSGWWLWVRAFQNRVGKEALGSAGPGTAAAAVALAIRESRLRVKSRAGFPIRDRAFLTGIDLTAHSRKSDPCKRVAIYESRTHGTYFTHARALRRRWRWCNTAPVEPTRT